jgi:hypothetical protein
MKMERREKERTVRFGRLCRSVLAFWQSRPSVCLLSVCPGPWVRRHEAGGAPWAAQLLHGGQKQIRRWDDDDYNSSTALPAPRSFPPALDPALKREKQEDMQAQNKCCGTAQNDKV